MYTRTGSELRRRFIQSSVRKFFNVRRRNGHLVRAAGTFQTGSFVLTLLWRFFTDASLDHQIVDAFQNELFY